MRYMVQIQHVTPFNLSSSSVFSLSMRIKGIINGLLTVLFHFDLWYRPYLTFQ